MAGNINNIISLADYWKNNQHSFWPILEATIKAKEEKTVKVYLRERTSPNADKISNYLVHHSMQIYPLGSRTNQFAPEIACVWYCDGRSLCDPEKVKRFMFAHLSQFNRKMRGRDITPVFNDYHNKKLNFLEDLPVFAGDKPVNPGKETQKLEELGLKNLQVLMEDRLVNLGEEMQRLGESKLQNLEYVFVGNRLVNFGKEMQKLRELGLENWEYLVIDSEGPRPILLH